MVLSAEPAVLQHPIAAATITYNGSQFCGLIALGKMQLAIIIGNIVSTRNSIQHYYNTFRRNAAKLCECTC